MTAPDIAAIEARLAAATPGPWFIQVEEEWDGGVAREATVLYRPEGSKRDCAVLGCPDCGTRGYGDLPDAELIAHAPADIAALLSRFDLASHLARQREFSERAFGPGARANGVIAHIREELDEVAADPTDLTEWIDIVILALDGAWRAGGSPQHIIDALVTKQARNEAREWPDWRGRSEDEPINHVRAADPEPVRGPGSPGWLRSGDVQ